MLLNKIKEKSGYITALSPMEGVTDSVFRQMICNLGRPDLFFTEFLNVEGYCSKGRENVSHRIKFADVEKPIIVQLWGNVPEYYAKTIKDLFSDGINPDGIDINMGCSVRDVLSGGRGSALINDKGLVIEIIDAVKSSCGSLPVSVKTRIGFDKIDTEDWIVFLLQQGLDLITVHGRLSRDSYSIPSRWNEIGKCVKLRDEISPSTLILGNGDLKSVEEGVSYVKKYNVDGFMIGRYVMNNPWVFACREGSDISKRERIEALLLHLDLFEKTWNGVKPFSCQKKYVKAYLSDFDDVSELRSKVLLCECIGDMRGVLLCELDKC